MLTILFFSSLALIVLMLIYKTWSLRKQTHDEFFLHLPFQIQTKSYHSFLRNHKKLVNFARPRAIAFLTALQNRFSTSQISFSDFARKSVNDSKKGASSFFLKHISEHKKRLRDMKE